MFSVLQSESQDDLCLQNDKPTPIPTFLKATCTTSYKGCCFGVSCGFKMLKLAIEGDYLRWDAETSTPFPFSCFPFTEANGHHMSLYLILTSWNQYPYSPYCSHRILKGTDKENLFKSQELLLLLIFLLILVTTMCDSEVIL